MRLHHLQLKALSQAQPLVSAAWGSPSLWAAPAPRPLHPAFVTFLAAMCPVPAAKNFPLRISFSLEESSSYKI